uniref:Putative p32 protein n=1 Tax=Ixodes ricinus TaxID=34613 RepID=A0A0K8RLM6_IXORI
MLLLSILILITKQNICIYVLHMNNLRSYVLKLVYFCLGVPRIVIGLRRLSLLFINPSKLHIVHLYIMELGSHNQALTLICTSCYTSSSNSISCLVCSSAFHVVNIPSTLTVNAVEN